MQKIIPHLWFNTEAEEAVSFYKSVFSGGATHSTVRYTEAGHKIHKMNAGDVMTIEFEIEGFRFVALNGGPYFTFTPAISFMVNCSSTEEVDNLWAKLIEGGEALMQIDAYPFSKRYGWVKDKYGVTWQLIYRDEPVTHKITPSLMYAGNVAGKAEEAYTFYTSIFEHSSIGLVARYGAGQEPDKEGTIMYADFILDGQKFAAMDSAQAHEFTFNEAVSLMVMCDTQEEIDYFWEKISAVPESEQCGWLKDKYGVSWQVVPRGMDQMLNDPDNDKVNRAMNAVLSMKKLNIAEIKHAFEGK